MNQNEVGMMHSIHKCEHFNFFFISNIWGICVEAWVPENSSILKSMVHCTDNNIVFHTKFQVLNVNC